VSIPWVSSEGAAGLYIDGVSAVSTDVRCGGAAELSIDAVQASAGAAFSASGTCNLEVKTGSSASSAAEVRGVSNMNLGAFSTGQTVVEADGACSFAGQSALHGVLGSKGAAYVSTELKDGGSATCHGLASVYVKTSGTVDKHKNDLCSVEVSGM